MSKYELITKSEFLEASREELRVLIAVRELSGNRDAKVLAEICGISVARARSAIAFWDEIGALGEEKAPSVTEEFEERLRRGEITEEPAEAVAKHIRDAKLAELFSEIATLLKRASLTTPEIKKLTSLNKEYLLSREYILSLAAHLESKNRLTVQKLVDEALKLIDKDIDSADKLISYLSEKEKEDATQWEFRGVIGIYNRSLTEKEKTCFKRWSEEYGYYAEIVREAFNISADAGKATVSYMDKILSSWHAAGCKTLSECRAEAESHRANGRAERENNSKKRTKKPAEPKERCGDFDIEDAFAKALQRSYGTQKKD